jgi:hypothetical protein
LTIRALGQAGGPARVPDDGQVTVRTGDIFLAERAVVTTSSNPSRPARMPGPDQRARPERACAWSGRTAGHQRWRGSLESKFKAINLTYVRDTSAIGNRTLGVVLSTLLQAGRRPLLPFGDGHPYDLAVDQDGELRRVQCKTGRLVRGAVVFATTRYTGRKHRTYQEHEIDYFGVYCPDTDAVYLVPIEDVGPHTSAYLRVEPARNNQTKGVRWAVDYQVMPKSD